ncbi:MAG: TlpA family protein disulfide reductase, partial [Thermomicrobia bacterium]|nr:TlpA family protein disulfide reductase [Thermomicrobia bacterium]
SMAEQPNDALVPEATPPLRSLPRGVQVSLGLVLVVAILLATLLFNRENGGRGLTDPGATLPRIGDRLAVLPITDSTGAPFDMATLTGHPVWINVWASWCGPCKAEMPDLEAVSQEVRATHPDFVLLSLNTADNRQDGMKFFDDLRLTSTLAFNNGSRDIGPYRIQNFPTSILVDRNGIVRQVLQRSVDKESAQQELKAIL